MVNFITYRDSTGGPVTFNSKEILGNEWLCKTLGYGNEAELKKAQESVRKYWEPGHNRLWSVLNREKDNDAEEDFPPAMNN